MWDPAEKRSRSQSKSTPEHEATLVVQNKLRHAEQDIHTQESLMVLTKHWTPRQREKTQRNNDMLSKRWNVETDNRVMPKQKHDLTAPFLINPRKINWRTSLTQYHPILHCGNFNDSMQYPRINNVTRNYTYTPTITERKHPSFTLFRTGLTDHTIHGFHLFLVHQSVSGYLQYLQFTNSFVHGLQYSLSSFTVAATSR